GFFNSLKRSPQAAPSGASRQALSGDLTVMSLPPTASFSFAQLAVLGQPGSEGRTRRTGTLTDAASDTRGGSARARVSAARRCNKLLRFIGGVPSLPSRPAERPVVPSTRLCDSCPAGKPGAVCVARGGI